MKPNDENAKLPPDQRPFRILIISGSDRRQYNCPGVDSKSRMLMLRMAKRLPQEWEIDYEDLGNVFARARIQSCNACVSTSMALCVWPCNCYKKNDKKEPDLMWDLDMYARLDMADAWAIIGPHNWYAPSSNLKLMFDRLVCMNGGNPDETTIDHKDALKAMAFEHTKEWEEITMNHLEGRTAAFYCYGDQAGEERDGTGTPKILKHKEYLDPKDEEIWNTRHAYAPLVLQCRYSGIEVPDHLWAYKAFATDKKYSDNQAEHLANNVEVLRHFDEWTDGFAKFVSGKGKVKPGKYRAYGFNPSSHFKADIKDGLHYFKMMIGKPQKGSSPWKQQQMKLNEDATWHPKSGEGKKLRKK
jgi:multimeric flavodoxin WrbA